MKHCKHCTHPIQNRNKNAVYCGDDCYKLAKNNRDKSYYHNHASVVKEIKRNDQLLGIFFRKETEPTEITYELLRQANFNFGISTAELASEGRIFKRLDTFCYHLDLKTKLVLICPYSSTR